MTPAERAALRKTWEWAVNGHHLSGADMIHVDEALLRAARARVGKLLDECDRLEGLYCETFTENSELVAENMRLKRERDEARALARFYGHAGVGHCWDAEDAQPTKEGGKT